MSLYVDSVHYLVLLIFACFCYFPVIQLIFFNILFMFVFLFCTFFSISCILCFCVVFCPVSPFVHSCLFPIFVQVYQPLAPAGNPIAVNKYNII